MQQTKLSIGPILFLYYEESLVSSNLNSKQLRFHGAHPNFGTKIVLTYCEKNFFSPIYQKSDFQGPFISVECLLNGHFFDNFDLF